MVPQVTNVVISFTGQGVGKQWGNQNSNHCLPTLGPSINTVEICSNQRSNQDDPIGVITTKTKKTPNLQPQIWSKLITRP